MADPVAMHSLAPVLTAREFEQIRNLAHATFGLDLRPGKECLVAARLSRHLRTGGFRSFDEYIRKVIADKSGEQLITLIDSLTTNHTGFLREIGHFNFLRDVVLPEYESAKPVSIWSAASSSGEEPHSILFTSLNSRCKSSSGIRLTASDISRSALALARSGIYSDERLSVLPFDWKVRYFERTGNLPCGFQQVRPAFRKMIHYQRINLMDPFPFREKFHVIFCRNVMIYFDRKTQGELVNKLAQVLEPGGYLFVGHAESLSGMSHSLGYIKPAIYRKR